MRWLVFALALGACSGPTGEVGSTCKDIADCTSGPLAACIAFWPEGYCTEIDCTIGSCPAGSTCVTGVSFPNVEFTTFCFDICTSDEECRTGYTCGGLSGVRACLPVNP